MDEVLPTTFLMAIQLVLLVFTTVLVPTVTNPWLLFVVVPMTVLVVYVSRYYLKTSRELKRLESIYRSPVFSHISETLNGLDTIRTRGRQRDFVDRFYRYVKKYFLIYKGRESRVFIECQGVRVRNYHIMNYKTFIIQRALQLAVLSFCSRLCNMVTTYRCILLALFY